MLTCAQTSELCSDALDRPIRLRERLDIEMHVLMCPHCRRERRQLRALRAALVARGTRSAVAVVPEDDIERIILRLQPDPPATPRDAPKDD